MINEILSLKPSIQGSILISLKINSTNFAIIYYPKRSSKLPADLRPPHCRRIFDLQSAGGFTTLGQNG